MPGFRDTRGILNIIAKKYTHHIIYSKVKKIKFILCFDVFQL
jgi:hypothetical protein